MASVKTYIQMTQKELRDLSNKDLRSIVQQMADAGNKRIKRLLESEIGATSPVFSKNGGEIPYYSVKGIEIGSEKERSELIAKYKKLKNVLNPSAKIYSVSAWKKEVKKIEKRIGGPATPDMWKAYREIERMYGGQFPNGYDSTEVQRMVVQVMENTDGSFESIVDEISRRLNNADETGILDEEEFFDLDEFEPEY